MAIANGAASQGRASRAAVSYHSHTAYTTAAMPPQEQQPSPEAHHNILRPWSESHAGAGADGSCSAEPAAPAAAQAAPARTTTLAFSAEFVTCTN
jgi:hypothetical protein